MFLDTLATVVIFIFPVALCHLIESPFFLRRERLQDCLNIAVQRGINTPFEHMKFLFKHDNNCSQGGQGLYDSILSN